MLPDAAYRTVPAHHQDTVKGQMLSFLHMAIEPNITWSSSSTTTLGLTVWITSVTSCAAYVYNLLVRYTTSQSQPANGREDQPPTHLPSSRRGQHRRRIPAFIPTEYQRSQKNQVKNPMRASRADVYCLGSLSPGLHWGAAKSETRLLDCCSE